MENQANEHCYGNCGEFNAEPVTSVPINTLGRIDMTVRSKKMNGASPPYAHP